MNTELFSVSTNPLTFGNVILIFGISVILAGMTALLYIFTHRKVGYRPSFAATLILLSPVASLLMLIIGNSMARALSIGGGIALIRFRTNFENPKDLTYIFMSFAVGIACGTGLIGLAVAADIVFVILLLILPLISGADANSNVMRLRITIPEDMNYCGVFDGTLDEYCKSHILESIKTTDFGTLVELRYTVNLRDMSRQKEFMDELRIKNGNLNIILTRKNFES